MSYLIVVGSIVSNVFVIGSSLGLGMYIGSRLRNKSNEPAVLVDFDEDQYLSLDGAGIVDGEIYWIGDDLVFVIDGEIVDSFKTDHNSFGYIEIENLDLDEWGEFYFAMTADDRIVLNNERDQVVVSFSDEMPDELSVERITDWLREDEDGTEVED